jgi:hypothetical protein
VAALKERVTRAAVAVLRSFPSIEVNNHAPQRSCHTPRLVRGFFFDEGERSSVFPVLRHAHDWFFTSPRPTTAGLFFATTSRKLRGSSEYDLKALGVRKLCCPNRVAALDHEAFRDGYIAGWRSLRGEAPEQVPSSPVFVRSAMYMLGFSRGTKDARSMTPDDPVTLE